MTSLRRLGRILALALFVACMPLPAFAQPALWVAHSGKSTVYLFGTVHILPDHVQWHSPELDKALKSSQTLYLELTDDDMANMQALVLRYGLDLDHPLSGKLDPGDVMRLKRAARVAGLPGGEATLEPMRPWLAGLTLSVAPLLKAGMDPESGADKQLRAEFEAAGKPVKGLETAQEQVRFFAEMPSGTQLAYLRSVLRDFQNATREITQLVDEWEAGEVDAIAKTADLKMRSESPALYDKLIVDRNKAWARQLATLTKTPGTYFVAVGAAHLAGPDSVQKQLAAEGIIARRLP